MRSERFYTKKLKDPYDSTDFKVYSDENHRKITVPSHWSQMAVETLVDHVFYASPLPLAVRTIKEHHVPNWLCRHEIDTVLLEQVSDDESVHYEEDVRAVFDRIAGALTYLGWKNAFFDEEEDAAAFYDELRYVLLHQIATPELSLLKYIGLDWAYGLELPVPLPLANQISASDFINEGYFHSRQEAASGYCADHWGQGRGVLKSFLDIFQKWQNCTTHQKPAVFQPVLSLDVRHPECDVLLAYKRVEEQKKVAIAAGKKIVEELLNHIMDACDRGSVFGFNPKHNRELRQAVMEAKAFDVPDGAIQEAIQRAEQGDENIVLTLSTHNQNRDRFFTSEPTDEEEKQFRSAIRIPDEFMEAVITDHAYVQKDSQTGEVLAHCNAQQAWQKISDTCWAASDPSLLFSDRINDNNPFIGQAEIKTTSAPGGFTFFEDSVAPYACLNLCAFNKGKQTAFDCDAFKHVSRLMTVMMNLVFCQSGFSNTSYNFRPIGLGVTNLAAFLMGQGVAYDSEQGRCYAASITSLLTATAYLTSTDLAQNLSGFKNFKTHQQSFLKMLEYHQKAALGEDISTAIVMPLRFDPAKVPNSDLAKQQKELWQQVINATRKYGCYNAFVSFISPSMRETHLMDGLTVDLMPENTLVRFEGVRGTNDETEIYGKQLNAMAVSGLKKRGYSAAQIDDMYFYTVGHGSLIGAPSVNHEQLKEKGFCQAVIDALEVTLKNTMDIRYAFNKWVLGEEFCTHTLGFSKTLLNNSQFDMLTELGFNEDEIQAANDYCCGTMTLEGAPHLTPQDYSIFDCDRSMGHVGVRHVSVEAKIKMMAAVQPFLSGTVGHVISVPSFTLSDVIQEGFYQAWQLGLKYISIYREGSSMLHPASVLLGDCGTQEMEGTSQSNDDAYVYDYDEEDDAYFTENV